MAKKKNGNGKLYAIHGLTSVFLCNIYGYPTTKRKNDMREITVNQALDRLSGVEIPHEYEFVNGRIEKKKHYRTPTFNDYGREVEVYNNGKYESLEYTLIHILDYNKNKFVVIHDCNTKVSQFKDARIKVIK